MALVTSEHFGANLHLTNDSTLAGSAFRQMLDEIAFHNFRYPGGAITEKQTWENGGLERMFGDPMDPTDPNYVITLGEALQMSIDLGASLSIVIPTWQFYDPQTDSFDHAGFDRYLDALEDALATHPDASISGFEIGNEYWASIDAVTYGKIANHEIPKLHQMLGNLDGRMGENWQKPAIGIQAGTEWRSTGISESHQIANQISLENRALVDKVYQHNYPNPHTEMQYQTDWAYDPAAVYMKLPGFSEDLIYSLSEFNIERRAGPQEVYGVNQATIWIEEFARQIDAGFNEIDHWGLNYKNLTNKFYDRQFPAQEGVDGGFVTIATPMGQVYDLAESHLIGKETISDSEALVGIGLSGTLSVTGFAEAGERAIFLGNTGTSDVLIDLNGLPQGGVITTHHIVPADSPYTSADERVGVLSNSADILDARGDMHVGSGIGTNGLFTLEPSQLLMLLISDADRDLLLEGAHHHTDASTHMTDDFIAGGEGNDIISGHVGDDILIGNGGNDFLFGGEGNDLLVGGEGDDRLEGGPGDDILIDGPGNNVLLGGDGNDLIVVQGGRADENATVDGGSGANLIVSDGSTNVWLEGFQLYDEHGVGDTLGFGGAFADADALQDAMHIEGNDLVLEMPSGTTFTIAGGAAHAAEIAGQVLDFMPPEQATGIVCGYFDNLNTDQYRVAHEWVRGCAEVEAHRAIWDAQEAEFAAAAGFELEMGDDVSTQPGAVDGQPGGEDPAPGSGGDTPTGGANPGTGLTSPAPTPGTNPEPEDYQPDPDHYPDNDGPQNSDGSGGGCFVATAAYGDRLHPDVVALRTFRDHHLIRYRAGRTFIRVYWIVGPMLARVTTPTSPHGRLARSCLHALVGILARRGLTTKNAVTPTLASTSFPAPTGTHPASTSRPSKIKVGRITHTARH